MNDPIIIIGFDPGETTGYARIHLVNTKIEVWDYGLIPIKSDKFYSNISDWIENYYETFRINETQTVFAVEAPLPRGIIAGGQVKSDEVRGIVKAIAEKYGIKYFLYQATSVKKSFGSGRYTKAQLRRVVQMILKTGTLKSPDVADALAVATCCALREFRADLDMEGTYQPPPKEKMKKKKMTDYSDEEIERAVKEGRAVMKGKRIIKIVES